MSETNKSKWTKTSSFLLPATDIDIGYLLRNGFVNAYMDDSEYERYEGFPDVVFVLFKLDRIVDKRFMDNIRNNSAYIDEYDPEEGYLMIILKIKEEWRSILEPFKRSKYSQMDKRYVAKYHPENIYLGVDNQMKPVWQKNRNWQILNRDPTLRKELEERIGVEIPIDYEVHDRIYLEEEIFNYEKQRTDTISNPVGGC